MFIQRNECWMSWSELDCQVCIPNVNLSAWSRFYFLQNVKSIGHARICSFQNHGVPLLGIIVYFDLILKNMVLNVILVFKNMAMKWTFVSSLRTNLHQNYVIITTLFHLCQSQLMEREQISSVTSLPLQFFSHGGDNFSLHYSHIFQRLNTILS